ncbi:cytochrome c [Ectothiorhodospiraceae bacterium WFHF3C12]|nr:cytochrome c [Ectothiorhodospiraceae bacterium WFHF3C12]
MSGTRFRRLLIVATALLGVAAATPSPAQSESGANSGSPSGSVARGEYLARIANCAGCHTAPGGAPFAGGLRLESDLGVFHTPNITPHAESGIGTWSSDDLWAALHRGERPDGSSLYPACPYPSLTRVTRRDVDDIHAYLRTVPPAGNRTAPHELDFPFGYRALLPIWKGLYFDEGVFEPRAGESDAWNRGAYLVRGLGHCLECHRERNFLGAVSDDPGEGGSMVHGWYAPSLDSRAEAGLQGMSQVEAAAFLRTGRSTRAVMMGPMAGVVFESLQYLSETDARAMAAYLASLPDSGARAGNAAEGGARKLALGRRVYDDHCSDCHGESGEGGEGVVPLAGNPGVTTVNPANVVNAIRLGGFPASVPGHERPHGMPPHYDLSDREVAAVATFIRQSWGNRAPPVSTIDVRRD